MKTGSPAHFRKECGEKKSLFIWKKITYGVDHVGVTRFSDG